MDAVELELMKLDRILLAHLGVVLTIMVSMLAMLLMLTQPVGEVQYTPLSRPSYLIDTGSAWSQP